MDRREGHMTNLKNAMKRHAALAIALLVVMVAMGALGGQAAALTISTPLTSPCPFTLVVPAGEDLLITSTGSIKCDGAGAASGADITITVPSGNMVMDAGSEITAENTSGAGNGGNISITVSGNFTMHGTGVALPAPVGGGTLRCNQVAGACISSSDLDGGGGKAGDITIKAGIPDGAAGGDADEEPGSAVLANSTAGSGGAIVMTAGLSMDVDGLVRSYGGLSGSGPISRRRRAGDAEGGCSLTITPDGIGGARGRIRGGSGAPRGVRGGGDGLVRSTVVGNGGHALPNNPANHCNQDLVTHPATDGYTACVEIWGNNVTINSILPNKGEVHADGVSDNTTDDTRAWIDVFATNNITINNDAVGPYSVHANAGTTEGDFGGLITIKAQLGTFAITGPASTQSFAVQANATSQSGQGGDVIIQAGSDVKLGTGVVQALGGASGSNATGGSIAGRSFTGALTGEAPGALNAGTATGAAITLQACLGVTYTGASTPAFSNPGNLCVPTTPTLPAGALAELAVLAPICASNQCGSTRGIARRRGRSSTTWTGMAPGIRGTRGCRGGRSGPTCSRAMSSPAATTDATGKYSFPQLECGTYRFCEVLQPTWLQTSRRRRRAERGQLHRGWTTRASCWRRWATWRRWWRTCRRRAMTSATTSSRPTAQKVPTRSARARSGRQASRRCRRPTTPPRTAARSACSTARRRTWCSRREVADDHAVHGGARHRQGQQSAGLDRLEHGQADDDRP